MTPDRLTSLDASFLYLETPVGAHARGGCLGLRPSRRRAAHLRRRATGDRGQAAPRAAPAPAGDARAVRAGAPALGRRRPVRSRLPSATGGDPVARRPVPARARGGRVLSRPLDPAKPLWELYVFEGSTGAPDRGAVEDAPRARRRHLGHDDRLGAVRPRARRRDRRAADAPWTAGSGADPRRPAARRRAGSRAPSARGDRPCGRGAGAHAARGRRDPLGGARRGRHGGAARRAVRHRRSARRAGSRSPRRRSHASARSSTRSEAR